MRDYMRMTRASYNYKSILLSFSTLFQSSYSRLVDIYSKNQALFLCNIIWIINHAFCWTASGYSDNTITCRMRVRIPYNQEIEIFASFTAWVRPSSLAKISIRDWTPSLCSNNSFFFFGCQNRHCGINGVYHHLWSCKETWLATKITSPFSRNTTKTKPLINLLSAKCIPPYKLYKYAYCWGVWFWAVLVWNRVQILTILVWTSENG